MTDWGKKRKSTVNSSCTMQRGGQMKTCERLEGIELLEGRKRRKTGRDRRKESRKHKRDGAKKEERELRATQSV